MMSCRLETIDLPVEHMRKHRQGMPVGSAGGRKSPEDAFSGQAGLDVIILRHIQLIIIVDKPIPGDAVEYGQDQNGQKNADPPILCKVIHLQIPGVLSGVVISHHTEFRKAFAAAQIGRVEDSISYPYTSFLHIHRNNAKVCPGSEAKAGDGHPKRRNCGSMLGNGERTSQQKVLTFFAGK